MPARLACVDRDSHCSPSSYVPIRPSPLKNFTCSKRYAFPRTLRTEDTKTVHSLKSSFGTSPIEWFRSHRSKALACKSSSIKEPRLIPNATIRCSSRRPRAIVSAQDIFAVPPDLSNDSTVDDSPPAFEVRQHQSSWDKGKYGSFTSAPRPIKDCSCNMTHPAWTPAHDCNRKTGSLKEKQKPRLHLIIPRSHTVSGKYQRNKRDALKPPTLPDIQTGGSLLDDAQLKWAIVRDRQRIRDSQSLGSSYYTTPEEQPHKARSLKAGSAKTDESPGTERESGSNTGQGQPSSSS